MDEVPLGRQLHTLYRAKRGCQLEIPTNSNMTSTNKDWPGQARKGQWMLTQTGLTVSIHLPLWPCWSALGRASHTLVTSLRLCAQKCIFLATPRPGFHGSMRRSM